MKKSFLLLFIVMVIFVLSVIAVCFQDTTDSSANSNISKVNDDCLVPCKADKRVAGECFTIRGRASYWNGNPSLRIWIIGTKRLLGVNEKPYEYACVPENLRKAFVNLDSEVYGEFTVCPFTSCKSGVMQIVCIDSVKISKTKQRK